MERFCVGDLVKYEPSKTLPRSLGLIVEVQDEDLIKVYWYVENIIPQAKRHREWLPAAILEAAGSFRILSKVDLTK
tara:strand:+ start:200 stop:427 length:228 start_codon:yes stop_codon:yes gene_type:complete